MKSIMSKVFITLVASTCLQLQAGERDPVARFSDDYKRAKTEHSKRSVCINAIDAGVIRIGAPIDDLKRIFRDDFEIEIGAGNRPSDRRGIVHFIPPIRSTNPLVSDIHRGWYLAVTYSSDGTLFTYCLTNEGKESATRRPSKQKKGKAEDTGLPKADVAVPLTPSGISTNK